MALSGEPSSYFHEYTQGSNRRGQESNSAALLPRRAPSSPTTGGREVAAGRRRRRSAGAKTIRVRVSGFSWSLGLEGWPGRPPDRWWWWFVGGEAGGDGAAGRVVGEAGWAVPAAGATGGGGWGGRGRGEERAVLAGVGGDAGEVVAGGGACGLGWILSQQRRIPRAGAGSGLPRAVAHAAGAVARHAGEGGERDGRQRRRWICTTGSRIGSSRAILFFIFFIRLTEAGGQSSLLMHH